LHPQAPLTQADPRALPVQFRQLTPHAVASPIVSHAPLVAQHVPPLQAPSPGWPHDAVHVWVRHVGVAPVQVLHAPPVFPHDALVLPIAHWALPEVGDGQHPPLQSVRLALPQAVPQVDVAVSHASSGGQSLAAAHPHAAPPMQLLPVAFPVQTRQVPLAPHASGPVPGRHVVPLQQPPLQAVCDAPPHVVLHWCVVVSQASPTRQSLATLHPHAIVCATHAEPTVFPVQSTHAPNAPHATGLVPG
jgi:hypothetical protein